MDIQDAPAIITTTPDGFVVKVMGAIHTNTAWLEGEFKKVAEAKPARVDIDLAETTFLSSMGIGTVVWLYNKVTEAGGKAKVVAIRKRVLTTLRFAGLDRIMLTPETKVLPD